VTGNAEISPFPAAEWGGECIETAALPTMADTLISEFVSAKSAVCATILEYDDSQGPAKGCTSRH
jgi:hypothetical protein